MSRRLAALWEEIAYNIGKILEMVSRDQETTGMKERRTKKGPRMAGLQNIISMPVRHIILLIWWLTSKMAVK